MIISNIYPKEKFISGGETYQKSIPEFLRQRQRKREGARGEKEEEVNNYS